MPQSLSHVTLHFVWPTKERFPFMRDAALRKEMHSFLAGISLKLNCPPVIINGVVDHVHLLVNFSRKITIADHVKEMKRASTVWMHKNQSKLLEKFYWQSGYGVFAVSRSSMENVSSYIENQEDHHRHVSFQDEYRAFLKKHGVEYDEKYVWD